MKFDKPQAHFIKLCYDRGFEGYTKERLRTFVKFNKISENDFLKITGESY